MSDIKVSQMLVNVSGDLLEVTTNLMEMQAHLDIVKTAWNISVKTPEQRKIDIKRLIKKQKKYAPSPEALQGYEWEIRRIIKQKDRLYPSVKHKVIVAEAISKSGDDYIIRAYFELDD